MKIWTDGAHTQDFRVSESGVGLRNSHSNWFLGDSDALAHGLPFENITITHTCAKMVSGHKKQCVLSVLSGTWHL